MRSRKRVMEAIFFLGMMGLTFWIIFHGQKPGVLFRELRDMKAGALVGSVVLALFFVAAEGSMIYILLHAMEGTSSLWRCIQYSYIGFFYSGITPSATGGQPMQLYYMKKDGNELSKSSIVLMTVALLFLFAGAAGQISDAVFSGIIFKYSASRADSGSHVLSGGSLWNLQSGGKQTDPVTAA